MFVNSRNIQVAMYVGSRDNGTIYVTNGAASESLLANAVARYGFENI